MQDEVRDKSVALAIRVGKTGGKLTADLLKWAIKKYMTQAHNPKIHHGKQTVKQLVKQGQGVQNIEITDRNIKSFEHVAKKYGVDFALKKDTVNGRYLVFFKAKDADVLTAAFKEYSSQLKHRETRPSVRKMLEALKDIVKDLPGKVREKKQERER